MSEFDDAIRERKAKIDRKAADLVRRGVSPWRAAMEAAQSVDDDAQEAATGYRPIRVRPMTVDR